MKKAINILAASVLALLFTACNENPVTVDYDGLSFEPAQSEIRAETGSSFILEGTVIAAKGLDRVDVTIPAWREGDAAVNEVILVKGSPSKYALSYEIAVPSNATKNISVALVFTDYAGGKIEASVPVSVVMDQVAPVIKVNQPAASGLVFSPREKVVFDFDVSDEKSLEKATLSCTGLGISRTYSNVAGDGKTIHVHDEINVTAIGSHTFVIEAFDVQGNRTTENIAVNINISSKPAIISNMPNEALSVSGGKLAYSFTIETSDVNRITSIEIKAYADEFQNSKTFTPGTSSVDFTGELDIPAQAKNHNSDAKLQVIAKNDLDEQSVWNGEFSIIKDMFITGPATIGKDNINYSMNMTHKAGTNEFVYKTYVESPGDWFTVWNGTLLFDAAWVHQPTIFHSWGKGADGALVPEGTNEIAIAERGYYVIEVNPVEKTYSVTPDTAIPDEIKPVWAQVNSGQYYVDGEWTTLSWKFIPFKEFPGNKHRYYMDLKVLGEMNTWEHIVIGLCGQETGASGVMYGVGGSGGYHYAVDGWASTIEEYAVWSEAGKISEKGPSPQGTLFRVVVDTYLMQAGWAPITRYKYPEPEGINN